MLCRPTKSKLLLRQMIGRGTRKHEGKDLCTIVDLVVQRRQEDVISASGIFDDLELSPSEQETMTIRDKIEQQKYICHEAQRLAEVLDQARLNKELEMDQEKKRRRQKGIQEDYVVLNIPDNVNLLLDTRLLRNLGLDAGSFGAEFNMEQDNLTRGKPLKNWAENDSPHDYQLDYLKEHTDYDIEDLSILKPMEAQSLINIIKRQTKQTSIGRRRLSLIHI